MMNWVGVFGSRHEITHKNHATKSEVWQHLRSCKSCKYEINTVVSNWKGASHDELDWNLWFPAKAYPYPLCHIFNLSFKTGYIPSCLETVLVKPIFKKGATNQFTNYRPISLLSYYSKSLEKIAANQVMKYWNKFKSVWVSCWT